ncbi:uncharacterized protein LOC131647493 [Vicia villosa]|uniref:uncharacterized protein LOC131647493 n=1 Tax=Vicia villosa TaxID=3911 RepID=UPI00273B4466|nr:uncharacterized protein LOC131647493 [Vicia villosa]
MKELLSEKRKLKHDINITFTEECITIIQIMLSSKLTDLDRFTFPFSINSLTICNALSDLGTSINMMPQFMTRKLNYAELKSTHMTLTLTDRSIMYPYGFHEDVLVRVDDLLFPTKFVIFYMLEDSKTPLPLGRPFLETCKAPIDVEMG